MALGELKLTGAGPHGASLPYQPVAKVVQERKIGDCHQFTPRHDPRNKALSLKRIGGNPRFFRDLHFYHGLLLPVGAHLGTCRVFCGVDLRVVRRALRVVVAAGQVAKAVRAPWSSP